MLIERDVLVDERVVDLVTNQGAREQLFCCNNPSQECVGALCGAWRWAGPAFLDAMSVVNTPSGHVGEMSVDVFSAPPGYGWQVEGEPRRSPGGYHSLSFTRKSDPERLGYCGLAPVPLKD